MSSVINVQYKAKGHLAKDCPEVTKKSGANVIELEPTLEVNKEFVDPWMRTMSAGTVKDINVVEGPTYKVDIIVDSVKTRVLLDHGAQVSIVCRKLLLKVRGPEMDKRSVPDQESEVRQTASWS